jgi:CMP-2-keto-3-deoxyoctulosonic acid synthetase
MDIFKVWIALALLFSYSRIQYTPTRKPQPRPGAHIGIYLFSFKDY